MLLRRHVIFRPLRKEVMGATGGIARIILISSFVAALLVATGCASPPERAAMSDEVQRQIIMDAIIEQIYDEMQRMEIDRLREEIEGKDKEKECIRKCDREVEEGCGILCKAVPDEAKCYSECVGNGFRDCLRKCRGRR